MAGSLKTLRIWHALIAILAVTAYLTDEVKPLHQWLGYTIAAMIVLRLAMALSGSGALGLKRFYPQFHDLKLGSAATHPAISSTLLLGIAISLIGVATTGILMDRGRALQAAPWSITGEQRAKVVGTAERSPSLAAQGDHEDDHERDGDERRGGTGGGDSKDSDEGEDGEDGEGLLGEIHELFANLLVGLVALHVSYLILFKWPLARFMLFVRPSRG